MLSGNVLCTINLEGEQKMDWEIMRLDNEIEKRKMSKKKRFVLTIVFVAILLLVFITDDIQQRRFATLEKCYELMDSGKYEEAIVGFEEYLSVDSDLYWKLIKKVNGYEYSREKAEQMVEACLEEIHGN